MSITDALRAVDEREGRSIAEILAAILNADRIAVRALDDRGHYTPEDVARLNRVVAEYEPPAGWRPGGTGSGNVNGNNLPGGRAGR